MSHALERRIQRDIDSVSILSTLVSIPCSEDVAWTHKALREKLSIDCYRFYYALTYLEKNKLIILVRGECLITDAGRDYYLQACRKPEISCQTDKWRDEVLTGSVEKNGALEQTEIENAVLPKKQQHIKTTDSVDLFDEVVDGKFYLASLLRIDIGDLDRFLTAGRIRKCRGLDGNEHIGVFDRDGEYWQPLCRRCTKTKRSSNGK